MASLIVLFSLPAASQKIGLLLGSFVSDRWYLDQKLFVDRVKELGGECLVEIAYTAEEQASLAQKLIDRGVEVLAVVPIDATKARDIVALAKTRKVPVISYDRLILSNDITIYISYDNEKVGRLQAQYMLNKFPNGKYFLINGPTIDNNAILFRRGQLSVLQPYADRGEIIILHDEVMETWSEMGAFESVKQYLAKGNEVPDVVLAANDALATGVIQALPPHLAGKIAITGQDADVTNVRNIIAGNQTMTIYKPIRPLAYRAAEMAMDLEKGRSVRGQTTISTGDIKVPAILLDPMIVDITNYKETVIKDGHVSLSEVVQNLGEAFEQERNKIQLSLLQKENALEVQRKVNQRNTFIILTVFLIVSIGGLTFTVHQKQKNNRLLQQQRREIEDKNRELHQSNEKLKTLNEKLVEKREAIGLQRDAIAQQKIKLEELYNILAQQKDEIQSQNEKLEDEVQKRTSELVEYNRQLEQYAFITAHNLRAPVARILGLGRLIKMRESDPSEVRVIIDKLLSSSLDLDGVIKDLNKILDVRTFSMATLTQVDLREEMNNVMHNLRADIDETHATIECDFNAVSTIYSIKPYIHSILFNLVSNAIKYRHSLRAPVVKIKTALNADGISLVIADNGIGIDLQAYRNTIFKLYKRFHFHVEGRGLGLFMVKTQIESLGGSIAIESEVDKGTTITICLKQQPELRKAM
ncbi:MAG: substrate-binding domain-containing protein [Bacteroidota bacterium]